MLSTVMFLTVNTQDRVTECTVIWYVLTMVHSQYTAEQRYCMVKTYLHNNNIYIQNTCLPCSNQACLL